MARSRHLLLTGLLLIASPAGATQPPIPPPVAGPRVAWSGDITLTGPVTVPAGAELVLQPGTRMTFKAGITLTVHGRLTAEGDTEHPVRLQRAEASDAAMVNALGESAVLDLNEIELTGGGRGIDVKAGTVTCRSSRFRKQEAAFAVDAKARADFSDLSFEAGGAGLLVANGSRVTARNLTFRKQRAGVVITNGSTCSLENCSFQDNQAGIAEERAGAVTLSRCSFSGNQIGLALLQTGQGPIVFHCTFVSNKTGVRASLFSSPLVDACEFRDNEAGFSADQFSNPLLRYCTFSRNKEAVRFNKKSNGRLEGSRLERNGVALFADFSSYPEIRGNRFSDNEWHVRLGDQESIDFERRRGSGDLTQKGARERAKSGPGSAEPPAPLRPGVSDVKGAVFSVAGNAWDEKTQGEMQAGPDANISGFWDGRDQGPVTYEGFGDTRYAVDEISFLPFAQRDHVRVGPESWVPYVPRKGSTVEGHPARSPGNAPSREESGPAVP
ncbi:MAG: right-handed parallel beta-helix repeat-containing protein [Deltaproteobacteria bacterium]|nr:right-handed parallel beta-helix repeat-containing protein [Deltaproteobacteria bacterium]